MTNSCSITTTTIIEELIFRNKIKYDSTIEVLSAAVGGSSFKFSDSNKKTKYLILLDFEPERDEKFFDDIMTQYDDMTYTIVIIFHRYQWWLGWWSNASQMEDIFSFLRKRYIKILDADRVFSKENWLYTDDYFSIMI